MKTYKGRQPAGGGPGKIIVEDDEVQPPLDREYRLPEPRHHSPDGFAWGYGGSGPSDTALAILHDHLGFIPPREMYNRFKFDIVADLPANFELSEELVRDWVQTWTAGRTPNPT